MATKTLGTNANNSLTALVEVSSNLAADIATLQQLIKNDQINGQPVYPGGYSLNGGLYVPNRGVLYPKPGDYIGVDSTTGWPILVSALAIASGPWTHS